MQNDIRKSIVLNAVAPRAGEDGALLEEWVHRTGEHGFFQVVEFFSFEGEKHLDALAAACRRYGLSSFYLGGYDMKRNGYDATDSSAAMREKTKASLMRTMQGAHKLGAERVLVVSGGRPPCSAAEEEAMLESASSLYAEVSREDRAAHGATPMIMVEYFNDRGEPYFFAGPTARSVWMAQETQRRGGSFQLTYDLSHIYQLAEDPVKSLLAVQGVCDHIHLSNCVIRERTSPFFGDKHPPFGHIGGEVDVQALHDFLQAAHDGGFFEGRRVTVGMEVITPDGEDANEHFLCAADILDDLLLKVR